LLRDKFFICHFKLILAKINRFYNGRFNVLIIL
jgi:hypothetical protein